MEEVRWGLLSTASINRYLIPSIRASKRGKLVAVASRNIETATAYGLKWNIPVVFGSYDEMLLSDLVDAVYIGLPNHLHAEWSIKAMQAGKHVLCEKPLALSVDEVDQMTETSKQTGRILAEALMYRHHPQTMLVKELVSKGLVGDVMLVRGAFNFLLKERDNIRLNPALGGGSLWDVGIYPLSYAQLIMGANPISVNGVQWMGDTGIDETFYGQLIFNGSNSAQPSAAQILSSIRSNYYTQVEIVGTQGRLVINRPFNHLEEDRNLLHYSSSGSMSKIKAPKQELYIGEINDIHSAIIDGKSTLLPLNDSRDRIRTIAALYTSAQTQKNVSL